LMHVLNTTQCITVCVCERERGEERERERERERSIFSSSLHWNLSILQN
jgi:hypothetical protein